VQPAGASPLCSVKDLWLFDFWRFVLVQEEVEKLAETAEDFPPMQASASLNPEAAKKQIEEAGAQRTG